MSLPTVLWFAGKAENKLWSSPVVLSFAREAEKMCEDYGLGCANALKTRGSADGKAVQWMKAVQWKADLNELREAMIQWLERALKQWQYSAG